MPGGARSNKVRKALREERRSDQAGKAIDARHGSLELALLGTAHAATHQCLRRRTREAPKGHDGNAKPKDPSLGRKAVD